MLENHSVPLVMSFFCPVLHIFSLSTDASSSGRAAVLLLTGDVDCLADFEGITLAPKGWGTVSLSPRVWVAQFIGQS